MQASTHGKYIRTISPGMHNDGGDGQSDKYGSPATRMENGVNGAGGLAGKQSFTCDFPIRKHPLRRCADVSRRSLSLFLLNAIVYLCSPPIRGLQSEKVDR